MPPSPEDDDPYSAVPMSDSLRALARRGGLVRLRRGTLVIVEGDYGDTLYIVLKGLLCAYSVSGEGHQVTYGYYGPGACVGEMGLDGGPRSANVEAEEPTLCARVPRHELEAHLRQEPAFAMELLALVIRRARLATDALQQLALNNVWGRLKTLLESMMVAQPDGTWLIDPAPSHRELAKRLACAAASITKALAPLQVGGYVKVQRRRILILKPLPKRL